VGASEDRRGNCQPKRLRGLEIDDQFEFGRLHDRQIGRLGAVEDFAGVKAQLAKHVLEVRTVAASPPGSMNSRDSYMAGIV